MRWPLRLDRAIPLFGSIVRIGVEGCGEPQALEATSRAVAALSRIQRLMSFHDPASELSGLNRAASRKPVRVSHEMMAVLTASRDVAATSAGAFDPTVAPLAVRAGTLPRPEGPDPDPAADWRDLDLDIDRRIVRFRRPLWLDLGGVAKGYAVDLATAVLRGCGIVQGSVNAGGDLRVFGPRRQTVVLDPGPTVRPAGRTIGLLNSSLASSGRLGARDRTRMIAAHFDPVTRKAPPRRFVTVMADRCVHADALAKVVLARGHTADGVLAQFGASAAICSAGLIWSVEGGAA